MMTMRVRVILLLVLDTVCCTLYCCLILRDLRKALIKEQLQKPRIVIGTKIPKMALIQMKHCPPVLDWSINPISMRYILPEPRSISNVWYM